MKVKQTQLAFVGVIVGVRVLVGVIVGVGGHEEYINFSHPEESIILIKMLLAPDNWGGMLIYRVGGIDITPVSTV